MSFSLNNQVDKLAFKVLAANVIDSNPNSRWYESRFPYNPVIVAERILNEFSIIKQYPASSLAQAQSNVRDINSSLPNPIVEDLSLVANSTRFTRAVPGRSETWVVYNTYDDPTSGFKDLWIQPQRIPRTDLSAPGSPSIGYTAKIWIGDPSSTGVELSTTAGGGDEVGWVFNYDMGILLFSSGMVDYMDSNYPSWETDGLWITGFRYVGEVGGLGSSGVDDRALYHALGKTKTLISGRIADESYKSGHNIRSREVWIDDIEYSGNKIDAYSLTSSVVRMIGTPSNPSFLYPLSNSGYKIWFLDTGIPTFDDTGFLPSDEWIKPLISPVDVMHDFYNAPSFGYEFELYGPDGATISYATASYEVDYFSGFLIFNDNKTPLDNNNGLGFTFSKEDFESSPDPASYLQSTTTGGPRSIAWQYTGRMLSDLDTSNIILATQSGLTLSVSNELSVNVDDSTIKINNENKIYVSGNSVYERGSPNGTNGDDSPTGITISNTPINYSTVKVFVNGQIQILGDQTTYLSSDCYFYDGVGVKDINNIESGDELYWNGDIALYNLSSTDNVLFIYEIEE